MYFNMMFTILRAEIITAHAVFACQSKLFGWNVPEAEILTIDIIYITSMSWVGREGMKNGRGCEV